MDVTILFRLGPALLAAWAVAQWLGRGRGASARAVTDELVRVLVVGLVAGRLTWMVLEPAALGATLSVALLVRAGVETGAAAVAAIALLARDGRRGGERWVPFLAVPTALAGSAAWSGLCQVQGVCAGTPVAWGVRFPGRAFPALPSGYVEAVVLAAVAVVAIVAVRRRWSLDGVLRLGAVGAAVRVAMGFTRPVLGGLPSRDQWWFAGIALALLALARVVAKRPGGTAVETGADVRVGA